MQAKLGEQGYTTLEDLADRWDTAEQARTQGPAQLEFTAGTNDFTQAITDFMAMRVYQAVKAAKSMASSPGAGAMITPSAAGLEGVVDRRTMEETYMKAFSCPRPKLEYQGSDSLLKRQFRYIAKRELGFIQVKHLVSALPEEGERPTKTSKRFTLDGWEGHEEEEVRSNPSTRRQLERMHMVFRTTLLMCTASQPRFSNLAITKQTWMIGMTGSTGRTLQEDIPLQRRPLWCMRKGMLGARSMTLSTVENTGDGHEEHQDGPPFLDSWGLRESHQGSGQGQHCQGQGQDQEHITSGPECLSTTMGEAKEGRPERVAPQGRW